MSTTPLAITLRNHQARVDRRMDQMIHHEGQNMGGFEVHAARQLTLAIGNTQSALVDLLHQGQSKVDRFAQTKINELESYVQGLEDRNLIFEMEDLSQRYINTLFMEGDYLPKLRKIEPNHIDLLNHQQTAPLSFLGNFKYARHRKYYPTLQIGESLYKPTKTSESRLDFNIDLDLVNPGQIPYIKATLAIPYESSWFPLCCPKIKIIEFSVWIGMLPGAFEVASSDQAPTYGRLFEEEDRVQTYQTADI